MTKVLPCKCESKFQDREYGKGNRLHNYAAKAFNGNGGYRCTVCTRLKERHSAAEERSDG